MEANRDALRDRLKEAGLSDPVIDAAWPAWWSDEAFSSPSARAELRFTIARKLGLSPKSLFHDEVEFVWKDDARFKHLSNETDAEKAALTSFGFSICQMLANALPDAPFSGKFDAFDLRRSILQNRPFIDLPSLLGTCWALGIPVIHLRVFPLASKRMHAMAVKVRDRPAIFLGRDAQFPAPIIFTLAHELGHVMLGHLESSSAIVDVGDPLEDKQGDDEEAEADQFALQLLLGTTQPDIKTDRGHFNAAELASTVLENGPSLKIEPGTLALCVAHARKLWPVASSAMQFIYSQQKPVWQEINRLAVEQLDVDSLNDDTAEYLKNVMGLGND